MPRLACRAGLLVVWAAVSASCGSQSTSPTPASCQYTVSPAALQPCMWATQLTTTVTTAAGCLWTAETALPWIGISGQASGNGPGTIRLSIADNWDAPRSGVVTVRWKGSATGQDVRVSQAGCYYSVTPASFSFAAAGGSGSFDVVQQSDPMTCGGQSQNACIWTAQSDSLWIVITSGMPRSGDNPVRFTVDRNGTAATRSGSIAVRNKVVRITQAAG